MASRATVAWGNNQFGQLGNGTNSDSSLPVLVPLSGVVAAAVSANNTYAVLANGQFWSWGDNSEGQLGIGTNIEEGFSPVRVAF